jgi:hypothetical protein
LSGGDAMGYYEPSFAGLSSGWYWSTSDDRYAGERDKCLEKWNDQCTEILGKYLKEFGMFLSAFERDIKKEFCEKVDDHFPFPDYFGYFIISKVLFDPVLSKIYLADYEARGTRLITCEVCLKQQKYDDIHPSLIGRTRKVLPLCNPCWFKLSEFTDLSALSCIPNDFKPWFAQLKQEQTCAICKRRYVWLKDAQENDYGANFIPGNHLHICPKCVEKAVLWSNDSYSLENDLKRFKDIADALGAIPEKSGFIYSQVEDPKLAVTLTQEMQKMRSFQELSKCCGSWFKLLVASGVLPEGSRKMKYGTMVLAKDGHLCLSLAEKQIDDLLYSAGIEHEREPFYPDSNLRADWLLTVGDEKIFIELFGLYGEKNYTKRMTEKLEYAKAKGIRVISFLPKDMNNLNHSFSVKVLTLYPSRVGA